MSKEKYNPYTNCSAEFSPIEESFAKSLESKGWRKSRYREGMGEDIVSHASLVGSYGYPELERVWSRDNSPVLCLAQFPVKPKSKIYFIDFAFIGRSGSPICVELDGQEFHEKKPENFASDRQRDRELTISGWRILRFSGSEVYKSVSKCVDECTSMLPKPIPPKPPMSQKDRDVCIAQANALLEVLEGLSKEEKH